MFDFLQHADPDRFYTFMVFLLLCILRLARAWERRGKRDP